MAMTPFPDAGIPPRATAAESEAGTTVHSVDDVVLPGESGSSTRCCDWSPTWIEATAAAAPFGFFTCTRNVTAGPEWTTIGSTKIRGGDASGWWTASSSEVSLVICMYGVRSG